MLLELDLHLILLTLEYCTNPAKSGKTQFIWAPILSRVARQITRGDSRMLTQCLKSRRRHMDTTSHFGAAPRLNFALVLTIARQLQTALYSATSFSRSELWDISKMVIEITIVKYLE